ncbi:MAG: FAD:protein FMN transferase, partial [Chloroflexi bacterium]
MLHRLEFHAMGCEMLALVEHESVPARLASVPLWFEEWEQVLSRFRYDSELTCLNRIHDRPVHVSEILWNVLQAARQAERLTDGLVTPTLLDAIVEAGYDRPFDVLPHQAEYLADSVLAAPRSLTALTVNNAARTVTLPTGTTLDFGGSAKGWAAHEAMKRLQTEGPALVNAGGDIAISGPCADGSPWPIGGTDPFQPREEIERLFLNACGVATSGKDRRR